jgi:hypothetical protein
MQTPDEPVHRVLDCANRVAGTALSLPAEGGDIPLQAFGFDSLSVFAFVLELEATCGIKFDEALLLDDRVRSIRSIAALVSSLPAQAPDEAGSRG